jgi:hypothetical protein
MEWSILTDAKLYRDLCQEKICRAVHFAFNIVYLDDAISGDYAHDIDSTYGSESLGFIVLMVLDYGLLLTKLSSTLWRYSRPPAP